MSKVSGAARYARSITPEWIVRSRAATRLRRDVDRLQGHPARPEQRVVHTLDEIDEMFAELDVAATQSDDALRQGFRTFRLDIDYSLPDDPYSQQYREAVLDMYEWLRGEPYTVANEETPFDDAAAVYAPFPYSTQSAATVGDHLMAIGHIIRRFELPPGSRVLEFGAGWGNTTLALAQMGHKVTAIDISPRLTDLINARAKQIRVDVETVVGDFSLVHQLEGQFDGVLFFESFHHCADHLDLIAGLDRVVAPNGRVMFAAEPIVSSFPVPWGLRLDGESLWAIRRHGWLELGFRRSYFEQALDRYGWKADWASLPQTPWGEIFLATRR
jgi:2-polyprenyl-3-methyl-5-hydroxy-6-metoxy-1,4-benzoquinol methylase